MKIGVVVPWHNCQSLIPSFELVMLHGSQDVVVIVDNASDPPLSECWLECWIGPEDVIRVDRNLGFSKACNVGLGVLEAKDIDAVVFLNNDVELAKETDWLAGIREVLRPGVLVGAHLRNEPWGWIDGKPHAYLDGWCLGGMVSDLVSLGGWDEEFEEPSYYGDNDLCFRAKKAGMRLISIPVPLRHLQNYTSKHISEHRNAVAGRNRQRFIARVREVV